MKEERYRYRLDEQFGESRGDGGYTGTGFQSSQCPWREAVQLEGGPEPSCLDINWNTENELNDEYYTILQDGGLCQSCRGFGHDEKGLFVICVAK